MKLLYLGYFGAFGISIPFFPSYLRGVGLSGPQVAMFLAVGPLFHLGVPLLWGWIADRTRRPDLLLRLACAGASLALVPLAFARSLPALVTAYALHQMFAVPTLGLMDSLALDRARRTGAPYTRLRLWGSASFLLCCWTAGFLFTWRGRGGADPLVPLLMSAGYGLAAIGALWVTGEPGREPPHARDLSALVHNRRFLFILVLAPLHWATLAPYHGFLGILALHRGFPPATISHAFAVSVVAEIIAFYCFRRLQGVFSLPSLLAIAIAGTGVRWALVAVSTSAPALIALQSLHGLSFGVFWGAAMAWVADCVPAPLRATGQAMYTTAIFGVGNLLGYAGAGLLYDAGSSAARGAGAAPGLASVAGSGPTPAFAAAAAFELLPLMLILVARRWAARAR